MPPRAGNDVRDTVHVERVQLDLPGHERPPDTNERAENHDDKASIWDTLASWTHTCCSTCSSPATATTRRRGRSPGSTHPGTLGPRPLRGHRAHGRARHARLAVLRRLAGRRPVPHEVHGAGRLRPDRPARRAGADDRAHRPARDRVDHLLRALGSRPALRDHRPPERRPGRLEHRHDRRARSPPATSAAGRTRRTPIATRAPRSSSRPSSRSGTPGTRTPSSPPSTPGSGPTPRSCTRPSTGASGSRWRASCRSRARRRGVR